MPKRTIKIRRKGEVYQVTAGNTLYLTREDREVLTFKLIDWYLRERKLVEVRVRKISMPTYKKLPQQTNKKAFHGARAYKRKKRFRDRRKAERGRN